MASKPNLQGTEAAFQAQVLELARVCGWLRHAERPAITRGGRWATPIQGDAGFPDLVLAKGGRILFWELKVCRGKLTEAQELWGQVLEAAFGSGNVEYKVVTPNDWDAIERWLKEA